MISSNNVCKWIYSLIVGVLFVLLFLFKNFHFVNQAYASTSSWDFSTSSNYTYDDTKIEFNSGKAQGKTPMDWYGSNWKYRKTVVVDNTNNIATLTNYQVKITLSSSNFDFSKAQSAGQDIYFTDSDGITLLNYWFENYDSSGQTAVVWVKIPSVTSQSTKTIYMYYGNSIANDAQNGDNTFIFFDDFTGILSTQWNKYSNYPVVSVAGGTWESYIVGDPWVIYDAANLIYRMWYFGFDSSYARIGYATSTDGIVWNKYPGNPILNVGTSGSYDERYAHKPSVVLHNGTYYMFYVAQNSSGVRSIALATSTNPEGPYTKYAGNPVLSPLSSGYENNFLDTPSVIFDTDTNLWKMWYSCGNIPNNEPKNWCYATSNDGYIWTKYINNPIATPPNDGSWLSKGLGGVNVTKENGVYHNYYNAFDNDSVSRIGYTTSNDGVTWNLFSSDKILDLGTGNTWDNKMLYRPNVLTVNGQKLLWYNASGNKEQIGLATYGTIATYDPAKWTPSEAGVCSISISSGNLVIDETYGGNSDLCITKTKSYSAENDVVVETRSRLDTVYDTENGQSQYILFLDNVPFFSGTSNSQFIFAVSSLGKVRHQSKNAGSWGTEDDVYTSFPSASSWYRAKAIKKSTGIDWYFLNDNENVLGQLVNNTDTPVNFTSYPVAIGSRGTKNTYDWFRSRKYTLPEPSTSSGNEALAYPTSDPTINPISSNSQSFTLLSAFSEVSTKNNGEIKYQISNDGGTTWYWYNSGWIETNSNYTESNTAAEINASISTFPKGDGLFSFKAYLHSDGSQLVQLDSVSVTYENDTNSPVISSVSSDTPSSTNATITWVTDENASSKIDYGLTSNYGASTEETVSYLYKNHSVELSNLTSCTTYHYRVRSRDISLNENVGNDNIFTTGGCTASPVINSQATSQIATLTGGSLSLLNNNSHGITLSVPEGFASSDGNFQAHQLDKTAVLNTVSYPTGYSTVGNYIYELKALTSVNTSISSFNQALSIKISYSVEDITEIDESSLKIWRYDGTSWNMLSDCMVDSSVKTVSCTTSNFSVFGLFAASSSSEPTIVGSSSSDVSNTISTCNDQKPGAKTPWIYAAVAQNADSILLYFTENDNPVNKYILEYGVESGNYIYGVQNMGVNFHGPMTFLVKSLLPKTTYYFRVRADNGCAVGDWSNEIFATTKSLVSANNLKFISSDLTVSKSSDLNNDCQTYQVISGDTLWSISEKIFGDGSKYPEIVEINKDKYPLLSKSDILLAGWQLDVNCGHLGAVDKEITAGQQKLSDVRVAITDIDNKPVEGALVTLHSDPQTTTTDKNGLALFHNVEQGNHKILVSYNNYEGEQSINLTGDVKEFDINIKIKKDFLYISPLSYGIIGCMSLLIVIIFSLLAKSNKGRFK